jgi:predicted PurR-regulated permease PerM
MADKTSIRISGPVLVSCAALVVVVAGLRAAQPIVVPIVVALFLAMLCLPPLRWLQEKGLPTWLALIVIITVIVLGALAIVALVGSSINELRHQLPVYQQRVADWQRQITDWLKRMNIDVGAELQQESFDMQRAVSLFGDLLGALGTVLSDTLIIVFTLIFMLLEATEFPQKLRAISGGGEELSGRIESIQASVRRYVSLKSQISLLSAVLVTAWLWILGVDFALLWGLLAFLFNFIPNIGSFIAAVPAVALALLQLGVWPAVYAAGGYIAIELVVGSMIEPRLMGRGLGLSPLVVFVSLIFWGWVLGPVGMLFSVPLTMVVKIVLDHSEDLQWVGVLLSSDAPEPARKRRK